MHPVRGFTLIEMMAVVVLIGLLAGATVLSLAGAADRATTEEVVGRIAHVDRLARFSAQRLGPGWALRIDLGRQQLQAVDTVSGQHEATGHVVGLPDEFEITEVRRADRPDRPATTGTLVIPCSPGGRSVTYALRVIGPEEPRWLVFAGLTGQMTVIEHDAEYQDIFDWLATGRADAD